MTNKPPDNDSQNSLEIKAQTIHDGHQQFADTIINNHNYLQPTLNEPSKNPNDILIKQGSELVPKDLLNLRTTKGSGFKADFYYSRPEVDGELLSS
ncbi:MAG: hypothetical protein QX189_12900 [Methylococcales bacterium]